MILARPALAATLLLLCLQGAASEYSSQSLSTFVDTLLAEYDREPAPAQTTRVELALDVRHASVDDASATMRLLADLQMSWNDSRLTWNASAWEGDAVVVPAERLWVPDVALASAGGAQDAGASELRARLTAAGAVRAVRRLALSVPIALQLADWPRDVQRAVFKFASRAYSQDEIDLVVTPCEHSVVVESGAWEVLSVSGSSSQWRRGEDTAALAGWEVAAGRRGAARAVAAGAVMLTAALMLLAAAALPSQQRPPLAAAAAFLAAVWLVTAVFHLPSAGSTPRLVRMMCVLAALGAAGCAAAAAVSRLATREAPPPQALRALLSKVAAVYTLTPNPESSGDSKSGAWAAAARLLDAAAAAALALAVLVLLAVHCLA